MSPRRRFLLALALLAVELSHPLLPAAEDPGLYVQRLNQTGYSQIAIDYLSRRFQKPGITDTERSEIELALAESYLASASELDQARPRDERLQLAREKFAAWIAANPLASTSMTADARSSTAEIDFLRGRLHVVLAHFPDNQATVDQLASMARERLQRSSDDSVAASSIYLTEYEKMPVFIPEDEKASHELKARLFGRYIEARFQAILAKFYRADSFRTIEYPPPTDLALIDLFQKDELQRADEYRTGIDRVLADLDAMYREHRRELVGAYCQMWMGRCHSAQGNYRKALGIYEQIFAHENIYAPRATRLLAYFRFITFMQMKEYYQVVANAEVWFRDNPKAVNEESYQGVQFETAVAYLKIAENPATDAVEQARLRERSRVLLSELAKKYNPFQGLATRELVR